MFKNQQLGRVANHFIYILVLVSHAKIVPSVSEQRASLYSLQQLETEKSITKLGKLKESFEAEQREVTNRKAREISELKSQLSKRDDELRNQAHQLKLRQDQVDELETKVEDLKVSPRSRVCYLRWWMGVMDCYWSIPSGKFPAGS